MTIQKLNGLDSTDQTFQTDAGVNVTITSPSPPSGTVHNIGWSGQLSVPLGGTGIGSYAVGDLLAATATTTLAKIAAVATGQVLASQGVNTAPAWSPNLRVSGNAGIGTLNPTAKLEVAGNILAASNILASFSGLGTVQMLSNAANPAAVYLQVRPSSGKSGYLSFAEDAVGDRWVMKSPAGDGNLYFATGSIVTNTDRVTFTSGGNVGVGTASPNAKLEATGNILASFSGLGRLQLLSNAANPAAVLLEVRPSSGKHGFISFTEDAVADRWVVKSLAGDGNLYFSTGNIVTNTDRVTFTSGGNVGVGTASPNAKLEVAGSILAASNILASFPGLGAVQMLSNAANPAAVYLQVRPGSGKNGYLSFAEDAVADRWVVKSPAGDGNLYFSTGNVVTNTDRVTFTSGGNVGVGTTSPGQKLHVSTTASGDGALVDGTTNPNLMLGNAGTVKARFALATAAAAYSSDAVANDLVIRTEGASQRILFNVNGGTGASALAVNNGNVGIGTASPGQKLTVAGVVQSTSGGFRFPDGTTQTSAALGNITGSLTAGRVAVASGATSITGFSGLVWDSANSSLQITRDARAGLPPVLVTATALSGNRTDFGSFTIPQMYGPHLSEKSYVAGIGVNIESDTSTTNPAGTVNDGFSSHAAIFRHNIDAGFTGYGIGAASYITTQRNSLVDNVADENDTYGFLAFVRSNNTVANNVVGMYSQVTADDSHDGLKAAVVAVVSNHVNVQADRVGIQVGNGDAADASAGSTDYTADAAIRISASTAANNTTEGWISALHLIDATNTTRFRVWNSGKVAITPTVAASDQLAIASASGDVNGANIKLTHTSEATLPNVYLRSNGGAFEVIDTTYQNRLLAVAHGAQVASNQTNVVLLVNNGSMVARTIEVGLPDTCGTGFRCLRVAN